MSGIDIRDLPDAPDAGTVDDLRMAICATGRTCMALIQVTLIEGVFTAAQKRKIVQRLTDAIVEVAGESTRRDVWCLVAEIASGDWGAGGQTLTADDVRALARSESVDPP